MNVYSYSESSFKERTEHRIDAQLAMTSEFLGNAFGELSVMRSWGEFGYVEANFTYDASGALRHTLRDTVWAPVAGRSVRSFYDYDGAGRLTALMHHTESWDEGQSPILGPAVVAFAYGYDAAGRMGSIATDWNTTVAGLTTRADESQSFQYDAPDS